MKIWTAVLRSPRGRADTGSASAGEGFQKALRRVGSEVLSAFGPGLGRLEARGGLLLSL